jgi:hypothetical protein
VAAAVAPLVGEVPDDGGRHAAAGRPGFRAAQRLPERAGGPPAPQAAAADAGDHRPRRAVPPAAAGRVRRPLAARAGPRRWSGCGGCCSHRIADRARAGAPAYALRTLLDALAYAISQISAVGQSADVRTRMSAEAQRQRPFVDLPIVFEALRQAVLTQGRQSAPALVALAPSARAARRLPRRRLHRLRAPAGARHLGAHRVPAAPVAPAHHARQGAAAVPGDGRAGAGHGAAAVAPGAGAPATAAACARCCRQQHRAAGRQGDRAQRRDRRALHHPRRPRIPAHAGRGRGRRRGDGGHHLHQAADRGAGAVGVLGRRWRRG